MNKTDLTIMAYNNNHKAYANKFMSFELYSHRMDEFIDLLPKKSTVLDLGCGPGNFSKKLMESGKTVSLTGVDLSEQMVITATKNVPGGLFRKLDIREIDFADEHFDAVVMSFCIVHIDKYEVFRLFRDVTKMLRDDGYIYLSFMEGKKDGYETTSFSADPIYFHFHNSEEMISNLKGMGFEIINIAKQDYPEPDGSLTTDVFIYAKKELYR